VGKIWGFHREKLQFLKSARFVDDSVLMGPVGAVSYVLRGGRIVDNFCGQQSLEK
jgi:hypothetical protein